MSTTGPAQDNPNGQDGTGTGTWDKAANKAFSDANLLVDEIGYKPVTVCLFVLAGFSLALCILHGIDVSRTEPIRDDALLGMSAVLTIVAMITLIYFARLKNDCQEKNNDPGDNSTKERQARIKAGIAISCILIIVSQIGTWNAASPVNNFFLDTMGIISSIITGLLGVGCIAFASYLVVDRNKITFRSPIGTSTREGGGE